MPTRGPGLARRHIISALAWPALAMLEGCASGLPPVTTGVSSRAATALMARSAAAHGLAALAGIDDISVSTVGTWHALVKRLQPVLVDAGFRGRSEDRFLLRPGIIAQSQTGPDGHKQVLRRGGAESAGATTVWVNGTKTNDAERIAAAALVADGYALFLLGPMLLAGPWADRRALVMDLGEPETLASEEGTPACDTIRASITPGLGAAANDQLALLIDRETSLMRRVRFTVNGLDSTRGAVAEVDTRDHVLAHGVWWPTRFHEQVLRPLPLPVHDWRLTGLDVNRGMTTGDLDGPRYTGKAAPAAGAGAT